MSMRNDYFYCYSKPLRNYLMNNGYEFITTAHAVSTMKQFWLFKSSDELTKSIHKYNDLRVDGLHLNRQ